MISDDWDRGREAEAALFYDNKQANLEALPVGEDIRNAVKYFNCNQPCTADQALAWAQLDDLSTGCTGDLNAYNPKTHMLHIELTLLHPDQKQNLKSIIYYLHLPIAVEAGTPHCVEPLPHIFLG
jgi:hypothetical protein